MARQLLGVHPRARARAPAPAAAVRDPAEGDRAARGVDPPLQGLGAPRRGRAPHQAGAEQAAPDRPDGEGRAARSRAPADRAPAPPARARRPAGVRAARRRRPVRRRHGARRDRPDRRARRADRLRRPERRGQERAPEDGRRRARAHLRRGLGRPVDQGRLPRPGSGDARPRVEPARDGAARAPLRRGRGGLAADEVPLPLRAGAPREQAALRRGAHPAAAAAPDGRPAEPARPRRAHEPPRHRVGRGARVRARGVRGDGGGDLARPLLPRPDRRPDRRGRRRGRAGLRRRLLGVVRTDGRLARRRHEAQLAGAGDASGGRTSSTSTCSCRPGRHPPRAGRSRSSATASGTTRTRALSSSPPRWHGGASPRSRSTSSGTAAAPSGR